MLLHWVKRAMTCPPLSAGGKEGKEGRNGEEREEQELWLTWKVESIVYGMTPDILKP